MNVWVNSTTGAPLLFSTFFIPLIRFPPTFPTTGVPIHRMFVRFLFFCILFAVKSASTIKKKRFVPKKYDSDVPLEVTSVCSLDQTLLEHAMGYEFIDQYTDQSGWNGGVTLSQFAQAQSGHQVYSYNKSYYCSDGNIQQLLSMTYQSDPSFAVLQQRQQHLPGHIVGNTDVNSPSTPDTSSSRNNEGHNRVFNARRFLSILRGKTIAFLGDSLARQHFEALETELLPFQSEWGDGRTFNGNGTHYWKETTPIVLARPRNPGYLYEVTDTVPITTDTTATARRRTSTSSTSSKEDSISSSHQSSSPRLTEVPIAGLGINALAAQRWYPLFDVTLLWCEDVGLSFLTKSTWDFCGSRTIALTSASSATTTTRKTTSSSSDSSVDSDSSSDSPSPGADVDGADVATGSSTRRRTTLRGTTPPSDLSHTRTTAAGASSSPSRNKQPGSRLSPGHSSVDGAITGAFSGAGPSSGPSPGPGANHVLIIAMGTHFKPANHPQKDYEARRARSVATMGSQVHAFRAYLHDNHYPGTVIWSLKPHHGPFDDLTASHVIEYHDDDQNYTKHLHTPHYQGRLWDIERDYETPWVSQFNLILRSLARDYHDAVLDLHSLSRQLLQHVGKASSSVGTLTHRQYDLMMMGEEETGATQPQEQGNDKDQEKDKGKEKEKDNEIDSGQDSILPESSSPPLAQVPQIHADSCHYCAGGLFRAANLLLLDVINHRQQCPYT